jgi:hypothetical protein
MNDFQSMYPAKDAAYAADTATITANFFRELRRRGIAASGDEDEDDMDREEREAQIDDDEN